MIHKGKVDFEKKYAMLRLHMENSPNHQEYNQIVNKALLYGKLLKIISLPKTRNFCQLADSLVHVLFLFYSLGMKKKTVKKRGSEEGIRLTIDDLISFMQAFGDFRFNSISLTNSGFVDLDHVTLPPKDYDEVVEIDQNSNTLFYFLLRQFLKNPRCQDDSKMSAKETETNNEVTRILSENIGKMVNKLHEQSISEDSLTESMA